MRSFRADRFPLLAHRPRKNRLHRTHSHRLRDYRGHPAFLDPVSRAALPFLDPRCRPKQTTPWNSVTWRHSLGLVPAHDLLERRLRGLLWGALFAVAHGPLQGHGL